MLARNKKGKQLKINHPSYIFLQKGNEFIYVTITHSNHVPNRTVIKFRKNPNPDDSKDAYFVVEIKQDTMDRFGKRHDDWSIDPLDDEKIRKLYK